MDSLTCYYKSGAVPKYPFCMSASLSYFCPQRKNWVDIGQSFIFPQDNLISYQRELLMKRFHLSSDSKGAVGSYQTMFSHPSDLCIITVRASLYGGLKTAGLFRGPRDRFWGQPGSERLTVSSLRCEPTAVRTVFSGAYISGTNGSFCRWSQVVQPCPEQ